MSGNETPAEIEAAAAEWVARLESGRIGSVERQAMEAWLARSDRHHGAFIRARALWHGIGQGGLDWQAIGGPPEPVRRRFSRRGMIAGGAGLAAAIGAAMVAPGLVRRLTPRRTVATALGEQRRLALGGGGSLLLDTESAVALDGTGGQVELVRGAALFDAAGELAVASRDAAFTAVRATFAMALGGFGTRVTVASGLVRLMVDGSRPFELGAGVRADISGGTATVRRVGGEEMARALAWTRGYLVFAGESLAEAAAMLNRYNRVKVVLGSGAPVADAMVGRFSIHDPAAFAAAVAKLYGLGVREENGAFVLGAMEK